MYYIAKLGEVESNISYITIFFIFNCKIYTHHACACIYTYNAYLRIQRGLIWIVYPSETCQVRLNENEKKKCSTKIVGTFVLQFGV